MLDRFDIEKAVAIIRQVCKEPYGSVHFCGDVVEKESGKTHYDVDLDVIGIDGHTMFGSIDGHSVRVDLDSYKYIFEDDDLLELWTEDELAKEEQYAHPDYLYFAFTKKIKDLT